MLPSLEVLLSVLNNLRIKLQNITTILRWLVLPLLHPQNLRL